MKTIVVIHFHPIEKFPPAFNLLRILAKKKTSGTRIVLMTTRAGSNNIEMTIPGVEIHRAGRGKIRQSRLGRVLGYFLFNIKAFFLLVRQHPSAVLYYETLSAGAPWLYRTIRKTGWLLFIHYHEYSSPEEYEQGMLLNRWLHKRERKLYKKAAWVSHTNQDRMRLFLMDCGRFAPLHHFVVPNYPPENWKTPVREQTNRPGAKIGFVYVGALDTENMYLKEMAWFVASNAAGCYWDIYSENFSERALSFLKELGAPNIHFKGGISYDSLPQILPAYQLGVILYKGHIPNYVFNAPNKLFEYAVCGLDAWFPVVMQGSLPYSTVDTYPKIVPVDFDKIGNLDIQQLTDKTGCFYKPQYFTAESATGMLVKELVGI